MKGLTFSGAVVIAALALPAVAVASDAPATPSIVLAGFTSQQYPTFFKIAAAGRSVTLGAVALEMTCTSGAQFVLQDGFGPVRISRERRVSRRGLDTADGRIERRDLQRDGFGHGQAGPPPHPRCRGPGS